MTPKLQGKCSSFYIWHSNHCSSYLNKTNRLQKQIQSYEPFSVIYKLINPEFYFHFKFQSTLHILKKYKHYWFKKVHIDTHISETFKEHYIEVNLLVKINLIMKEFKDEVLKIQALWIHALSKMFSDMTEPIWPKVHCS